MESKYKSIQRVSDSYLCSNCGACKVVCPKDAILFKTTSIGRLYASVTDNCINCGLCQKVCPSINNISSYISSDKMFGNISSLNVGKATNENIYKNAQSGGICTAILKYLFDSGKIDAALVCKMDYGSPTPNVKGVIIDDVNKLSTTQKSCYTPVELLGLLKEGIERYTSIAVVGLGCHIAGLIGIEELNKKNREKIYCRIGLICERSLCGTIQDVYSSYASGLDQIKINWKCKYYSKENIVYPYKNAPLVIYNNKGKRKIFPNSYRFVLKDMFTSPRCRVCSDKLNICSDITLGDPWGMSKIDWEKGESVIIGRTSIGEEILTEASKQGYITVSSRPLCELMIGQSIEQRRQQIEDYASAFTVLHPSISSHLLLNSTHSSKNIDYAKRELTTFKDNENLSKEEIIKIARKKISKSNMEKTIIYRIINKFFRLIKK